MKIRHFRGHAPWNQPALRSGVGAQSASSQKGVSRQTISSLEKGRYNPSILLAFKIARCFGQSIEEIFLYEEDAQ